jgi:hypothetical protein
LRRFHRLSRDKEVAAAAIEVVDIERLTKLRNHDEHNEHNEDSIDAVRRETGPQVCFSLCALCSPWFKAGGRFVGRP